MTNTHFRPNATHHVDSTSPKMIHALFHETSPLTMCLDLTPMSNFYKGFQMLTLGFYTYHVMD